MGPKCWRLAQNLWALQVWRQDQILWALQVWRQDQILWALQVRRLEIQWVPANNRLTNEKKIGFDLNTPFNFAFD